MSTSSPPSAPLHSTSFPVGQQLLVTQLGETPMQALEQHMQLVPQAAPEPDVLGPDEVLIGVRAAGAGWVDLIMASGQYQHRPALPYCPGLEYSGEVLWCGEQVTHVKPGDRVMSDGLRTGPRSHGPHQRYGGFATYAVTSGAAALPLPDALSFEQGCHLLGSYETAFHGLVACGDLQAEETVLIHGATGAIGLAAVQVAHLLGATVIATGRDPAKLEQLQEHGADHLVCTRADEGVARFRDEVKQLTGGKGVHVVYDGVGGATSLESLRCVRFGARYLVMGWASTPAVSAGGGRGGAPRPNQLPTNLIMMKGLRVMGCPAVISTRFDPSLRPTRLKQLMRWVEEGKVKPVIAARFPLSQVKQALREKWSSRHVGGIAVLPGA